MYRCILILMAGFAAVSLVVSADEPATPAAAPAIAPGDGASEEAVAKVGDEIITAKDYQEGMAYRWNKVSRERGMSVPVDAVFRAETLNEMIDGRIVRVLARNADIVVSQDDIDREYAKGRAALGSEKAYQAYLQRQGSTEDGVREQLRLRILTEKYLDAMTKDLTASEDELHKKYDSWVKTGMAKRTKPTMDILVILALFDPFDESSIDAAKVRIDAARKRIVDGESFEDVAREVSQDSNSAERGGLYPEIEPEYFMPASAKEIEALEIGAISEPIRSANGWNLIKVIAKNDPGMVPFEKLHDVLSHVVLAPRRAERLKKLVGDGRLTLDIQIFEKNADAVVPVKQAP